MCFVFGCFEFEKAKHKTQNAHTHVHTKQNKTKHNFLKNGVQKYGNVKKRHLKKTKFVCDFFLYKKKGRLPELFDFGYISLIIIVFGMDEKNITESENKFMEELHTWMYDSGYWDDFWELTMRVLGMCFCCKLMCVRV